MAGAHPQAVVYRPLAASLRLGAPITLVYRETDCEGPCGTFIALVRELAQRYRTAAHSNGTKKRVRR